MASKEELKIRLTKEQKDLIKLVSKQQGLTMSDFILKYIEPIARKKEEEHNAQKAIQERIENTEGNINTLRGKLDDRRTKDKTHRGILKFILGNK